MIHIRSMGRGEIGKFEYRMASHGFGQELRYED
jgi:hypothetical protein